MSELTMVTCSKCKKNKIVEDFISKDGKVFKSCIRCREQYKKSRIKNRCPHNKIKYNCRDCGGGAFCEHNKRKHQCRDCGGYCEHNKIKHQCRECGIGICEHNKIKRNCKECGDEIHITIKNMVNYSRAKDKKTNIYDENNFIDYEYVKNLIIEGNNICCYCKIQLQFIHYDKILATIERINNSLGHIKGNVKIACRTCNYKKVGNKLLKNM
jgi:hypothetical protein